MAWNRMRKAFFPLIAVTAMCGGCAPMIARKGTDLTKFNSREEIRACLGEPSATGLEHGIPFEEYRTHRKIAEPCPWRYLCGEGYAALLLVTCGTWEIIPLSDE